MYVLVIGWAVLLAGVAFLPGGDATVPEHRSATQAQPIVDRAVAEAISAAGPDAAATVTAYQLRQRCEVAQLREGGDFARVARFYTSPGGERALLQRLAAKFADRYTVRGPSTNGAFRVSLAEFVVLQATATGGERGDQTEKGDTGKGSGVVRVTVSTGCRPIDEPVTTFHDAPTGQDRERLATTLRALGVTSGTWTVNQLRCDGGKIRGAEVTAAPPAATALRQLREQLPAGARLLVDQPDLVAYRTGDTSVAVHLTPRDLTIESTVDCSAG